MKAVGQGGVSAGGRTYHRECFRCYNCRTVLTAKFYIYQTNPYCEDCYKEATCPSCALCSKIVDGDGVKIGSDNNNNNIYHIDCVR